MTAADRDFGRFAEKITQERCGELAEKGYVVIDDFLGHGWAASILAEINRLSADGLMKPNQTQFSGKIYTKPHIFEADMHDDALRAQVQELSALFLQEELGLTLEARLSGVRLEHGTHGRTLKLQHNTGGGGCFPWHYDNPGAPNRRRLTCLLYLNPDWIESHGGELCLLPFLSTDPVKIQPLMDRLVIFRSDLMLHRVLPAYHSRVCLTIWLDAREGHVNTQKDTVLRMSPDETSGTGWLKFCERLAGSPLQRLVSRGVYAEEYRESLEECMKGEEAAEGLSAMILAHESALEAIANNATMASLVSKLRGTKEFWALEKLFK